MTLDRVLTAFRIGDPNGAYPIFSATGSKMFPGRWNTAANSTIYASQYYATAMLEKLAHGSGMLPPNQHWIAITIPNGISYEMFSVAHMPTWADPSGADARAYGAAWQTSQRSVLLIVPSVLARMEYNFLLNAEHPECGLITYGLPQPCWWDSRLFAAPVSP